MNYQVGKKMNFAGNAISYLSIVITVIPPCTVDNFEGPSINLMTPKNRVKILDYLLKRFSVLECCESRE